MTGSLVEEVINDGIATVALTVSGISDESGNTAAVASGQTTSFAIDNTPPVATLAYHRLAKTDPDPDLAYVYNDSLATPLNGTQDLAIQLKITEAGGTGTVTGAPTLGITIGGTTTPVTLTQTATGSKVWRGRFTTIPATGDTTASVITGLGAVADEATNGAVLASGQVTSFAIDNTKPSVTLEYLIDGASYVAAPRAVRGDDAGLTVRAPRLDAHQRQQGGMAAQRVKRPRLSQRRQGARAVNGPFTKPEPPCRPATL